MVMEKHGDGLDLFEFIEMGPQLEEPLISHMFRQVSLDYLISAYTLARISDLPSEYVHVIVSGY